MDWGYLCLAGSISNRGYLVLSVSIFCPWCVSQFVSLTHMGYL